MDLKEIPWRGCGLYLPAELKRVRDADTVVITIPGGYRQYPIRIKGVDAPERGAPGAEEAIPKVQEFLRTANNLVVWFGAPHNPTNVIRDLVSFDRLLGDLFVIHGDEGTWYGDWLVREGLAVHRAR